MPKNVSKPRGKEKGTRNAVICVEETRNRTEAQKEARKGKGKETVFQTRA